MGLREIYNTSSIDFAVGELRRRYDTEAERMRIRAATKRKQLYMGGGVQDMRELLLQEFYEDARNSESRKKFVPIARFDNGCRRIVQELASLYRLNPMRRIADGNDQYQELIRKTHHDALMRRGERMLWLQNAVFLRPRIQLKGEKRIPRTDVLTQNQFFAISNPQDALLMEAIAIDHMVPGQRETEPRWCIWSDDKLEWLDSSWRYVSERAQPNPFGLIPGVLVHIEPPDEQLLEMVSGSDIEAAGWARWFASVLLLKELKSTTRQTVFSGDLTSTATGQQLDTDAETITGEGVGVASVDRGVDLRQFMEVGDHIVERAASNRGISPQTLRQAGATSGFELDLRRIPTEESRVQQQMIWRTAEREFAVVQSIVMAAEGNPEDRFSPAGWRIDFAEPARHLNEREKFDLREKKRALGHSNLFMELMEDNPDLTSDDAVAEAMAIQEGHAAWIQSQRALNISPSSTADDAGRSPQDNGASGGRPPANGVRGV
jgi:hypothetical protein